MLQRVKEVQESDLRMSGNLAHNIQRVIAVTQAQIDAAAAQGKAWVVKPVVKVSDPIDNLRGGTQLVIKQNAILPGQNVMRVMYVGGQAVVVGPGTSPLSLPNAMEDDILSLTAFGGTSQASTPTPADPVDITSNNGVLTYTPNLLDMAPENIVLGKYINNSGVVTDSTPNFYNSKYMPVVAGETYTWSTSSSINYFSVMEYDSDYVFKKRTLFSNAGTSDSITLRSDTAFVLIGSNMDGADVTLDKVSAVNWQFELGSTATSYKPYSPTGIYTSGPIETIAIKDSNSSVVNTATTEMLLSVDTYTDQQEVISGSVARKCGAVILDSSLEWTYDSTYGRVNATIPNLWGSTVARTVPGFCTHFEWLSHQESISSITAGQCYSAGANRIFLHISQTSAAAFAAWLDAQKNAGTPVIIVFPLENATTETVTAQPMQTAAGDNTLEITQASLSGLQLEVEYQKVA